jgi:adenylate kinase family enzyme
MSPPQPPPGDAGYPLGRRIAVFGKGGKTTLARALAARFDLEFVEQDAIRHQANWTEISNERHRALLRERFAQAANGWVSDGNYSAVRDIVYERVDTVIVLALPWRVMFWRTLVRSIRRLITREVLWNGNRESFALTFFDRNSVLYDLFRRRRRFKRFAEEAAAGAPSHVKIVIVRSARELDRFYAEYGLIRRPGFDAD